MKPTLHRLLLASSLVLPLAFAPPAVAQKAATAQSQVESFQLGNGLTVIIKPDHRAPTAVQMLWVRVGSMDEVDGATGLAHMLEHMLFKGTKKMGVNEFSQRVAALGGRENAFTMRDATAYYQQIPTSALEEVMRLNADQFANNRWPDVEFKREIEVVKEERRWRTEDQPRALLWEQLNAVIFQASPYRRPTVGWMSDLESMKPDDARNFYRQWYVPANAALVVAGDVDPAKVKQLAQKYYGALPRRAVPERKPRIEPEQAGIRRLEFKAPADQAYVALAFKVPQLTSFENTPENSDALALTVLQAVLDGYAGSRLDRNLTQGPDRVADGVGADNGLWGRGPQVFTLDGVPAQGKTPEQLEAALRGEVAKIAKEGITEAELQRVKTQWVASKVYKRDSVMAQAEQLGSNWVMGLPLDADDRIIEKLRGVTAEQVRSVAQRYFGDDQLTVGILRPQPVDPNRKPRARPAGVRD